MKTTNNIRELHKEVKRLVKQPIKSTILLWLIFSESKVMNFNQTSQIDFPLMIGDR